MSCVEGLVPRLEAQKAHRRFVEVADPLTALVDLIEARKLVKRDETATSFFGPGTAVITTSTISDDDLNLVSWQRELEIVEAFNPSYHIPTDVATYRDHSPAERRENVSQVMEGTAWMHGQLRDRQDPIELIPLIKGITPAEREICYQTIDALKIKQCTVYGTQYLTGGAGLTDLQQDVETIAQELDHSVDIPIFLIGLLSPLYLSRMPERVISAAGLRWLREIEPRSATPAEIEQRYSALEEEIATALGVDAVEGGKERPKTQDTTR